jgi:hypothetical protein
MLWPPEWDTVESLDLLAGSPIDCLLFEGEAPARLVEQARARGIVSAPLAVMEISKEPWNAPDQVLRLGGGSWPRVKGAKAGSDTVEAGPTGLPWVDFNGWMVEVARACAPDKTVWLEYGYPSDAGLVPPGAYALAVADAEAARGRWVVNLDPDMRRDLAGRKEEAVREWKGLAAALRFFESHREWRSWGRKGGLAVLSDFAGPNETFGGEMLNLLARRGVPMLALDKRRPSAILWQKLRAVFYGDQQPPDAALKSALDGFVRQGGLVIAGHQFPRPPAKPEPPEPYPAYDIFRLGKGRLAISREELADPWFAAGDAQLLASRRNDTVRFWNGGATNFYFTASPDGARDLLQIVCYASSKRQTPVTAGVCGRYRRARQWRIGRESAEPLAMRAAGDNWHEIDLPDLNVYAAIELER